jgi:ATP-dependent DNA ligase
MLLLSSQRLPEGRDWLYELKLDGYRALALKARGKVQLRSRNDNDFTARYPHIAEALKPLPNETVIDGEVVALDPSGRWVVRFLAAMSRFLSALRSRR